MERGILQVLAVALGLSLAAAVQAQARHDEKPHGPPKNATAKKTTQVKQQAGGTRHDERPHSAARQAPSSGTAGK